MVEDLHSMPLNRLRAELLAGASAATVLEALLTVVAARIGGHSASLYRFDVATSALTLIFVWSETDGPRPVTDSEPSPDGHTVRQFPMSPREIEHWLSHDLMLHDESDFNRIHAYALCRPRLARAGIERVMVVPIARDRALLGTFMIAVPPGPVALAELRGELSGLADVAALAMALGPLTATTPLPARDALAALNAALAEQVAARRRAEELARAHTQIVARSLSLLTEEPNLDRFLGHTLRAIVEGLGANGAALWVPNEDGQSVHLHLECVAGRILSPGDTRHPAARSLEPPHRSFTPGSIEQWSVPQSISVDDPGIPADQREYLKSLGVQSICGVPMVFGGTTIGWISIRSDGPPDPQLARGEFINALAGQATLALQQSRLGSQARVATILEERTRLAREIHDTLAQGLTALVLQLEAARSETDAGACVRRVERALDLARASLVDTRRSMQALRPAALERNGLVVALRALAMDAQRDRDWRVTVDLPDADAWPADEQNEVLRIAQEAVANAIRHSGAKHLLIGLFPTGTGWQLAVTDDGAGFDVTRASDGLGLSILADRAHRLGGTFAIESEPGQGAAVRVEWPRRIWSTRSAE